MNKITNNLITNDKFKSIVSEIKNNKVDITGLGDGAKSLVISGIVSSLDKSAIVICSNNMEAKKIINDINYFADIQAIYFPARDVSYYSIDAENRDNENLRMQVVNAILSNKKIIIVTTADSIIQKMMPLDSYKGANLNFKVDEELDINNVLTILMKLGYERYPNVEGKGQFSIRGGIIDVFAADKDLPCRIELFGNTIDTIRTFDVISQRSIDKIDEYNLAIAKEFNITEDKVNLVINKLNDLLEDSNISDGLKEVIKKDINTLNLREENTIIDKYFNLFFEDVSNILEYLNDYIVFVNESSRVIEKIDFVNYEQNETIKMLATKEYIHMPLVTTAYNFCDIEKYVNTDCSIYLNEIETTQKYTDRKAIYLQSKEEVFLKKDINKLIDNLNKEYNKKVKSKLSTFLLFPTENRVKQINNILKENNITCNNINKTSDEDEIKEGSINICEATITKGFTVENFNISIIAEPVSGTIMTAKRVVNKNNYVGTEINSFEDLNVGEYVVHESYGIGVYQGIHSVDVENVISDYIKIEYENKANVFVAIDNMDVVKKYVCDDDNPPKLSCLGTKQWAKARAKAKAHVEEIAKELIVLYAKRNEARGYAFSKDTPFQKEFEDTFEYDLTNDQQVSIEEIKEDMQNIKPMDRLLCGDVGFGKTEVALRAAFKAVMDGKQVAYLVPTTVLSLQQYNLFKSRMENFGIKVEMLSRFRSANEQKSILKGLKDGRIDVVVGTHRITSQDVEFKDIGLLIIDEEHRFGVKIKEKIKEYKENIDVLSMTATPIPRTLHMSMIGIRGISTLTTAPLERMPVNTYVTGYDDVIVKNAIEKELSRDGQVFYVSNRVENLESIAAKVKMLVPYANVEYAHGQMTPKQIEDAMVRFINHQTDIIVCTTILESGIDIPNANTIIVENSDRLGLASLYQIRGRVGRSSKLAYAYVTYDKNKMLSEVASKRLKAIKDFTEFGSGYKIAMRDLEIRGTGNVLGKAQSGHMAEVGYELYLSMLDRALKEESGKNVDEISNISKEVKLNIGVSAYIPDNYIKESRVKVAMYHKISEAHDKEAILSVVDEMLDRFGDIPKAVDNLIKIVEIRNLCRSLNITKVTLNNKVVILESSQYKDKLKYTVTSNDKLLFIQMILNDLLSKC